MVVILQHTAVAYPAVVCPLGDEQKGTGAGQRLAALPQVWILHT